MRGKNHGFVHRIFSKSVKFSIENKMKNTKPVVMRFHSSSIGIQQKQHSLGTPHYQDSNARNKYQQFLLEKQFRTKMI